MCGCETYTTVPMKLGALIIIWENNFEGAGMCEFWGGTLLVLPTHPSHDIFFELSDYITSASDTKR
jgi:hypothetical protein